MYLMYVDESGDIGLSSSPTRYFVLTGLIIHETEWLNSLNQLINFRRRMKTIHGLLLKDEIHSGAMISNPGKLIRIKRNDRLNILRNFAKEIAGIPGINIINVIVDKQSKQSSYDVFENAWRALIQRLENTTKANNFPHPVSKNDRNFPECALIIPDNTDNKKLQNLLRKMRRYNVIPGMSGLSPRNLQLTTIVEDPFFKDSQHTYFIQAADLAAYLLYQSIQPNKYMRKSGGANYFATLGPVLCTVASPSSGGIVRL